jgi:hypothetical protein
VISEKIRDSGLFDVGTKYWKEGKHENAGYFITRMPQNPEDFIGGGVKKYFGSL